VNIEANLRILRSLSCNAQETRKEAQPRSAVASRT
jgi:hypothetical protein